MISRCKAREKRIRDVKVHLVACLALFAASDVVLAQDLENGRRLSERWCAACHRIDPASGKPGRAPPFAAIAARDDITAATIASFLLLPHATMPNLPLPRQDAEDIAAYIMAMRMQ
jgi:mono/diheme cytochrome c family protein